jgi:hypothetical protein
MPAALRSSILCNKRCDPMCRLGDRSHCTVQACVAYVNASVPVSPFVQTSGMQTSGMLPAGSDVIVTNFIQQNQMTLNF